MPTTLLGPVVLVTPGLLMALGGILLWRRHHSVPTMLIAGGFTAALVVHIAGFFHTIEAMPMLRTVLRLSALLGLWVAAVGLFWHGARGR